MYGRIQKVVVICFCVLIAVGIMTSINKSFETDKNPINVAAEQANVEDDSIPAIEPPEEVIRKYFNFINLRQYENAHSLLFDISKKTTSVDDLKLIYHNPASVSVEKIFGTKITGSVAVVGVAAKLTFSEAKGEFYIKSPYGLKRVKGNWYIVLDPMDNEKDRTIEKQMEQEQYDEIMNDKQLKEYYEWLSSQNSKFTKENPSFVAKMQEDAEIVNQHDKQNRQ
ncbi:hypothetical protein NDK47_08800 [Brevibacillus ruminantium]|uniref:Uncharacterized protein n=1 Tax=Brevibacillus ruminantium TaxID=2950604 RepID=A0ABY4WMS2_9BACL|nr:hypothetical protein [Brevibacillus ruminantium]USG67352.1 hypothetical protein NDK47_08800 [Brevibacillus ruminantium]